MSNHMEHLNAICDMKDRFIEWTKEELGKGKEAIDTQGNGRGHRHHQGSVSG